MKKLLIGVTLVASTVLLAACGNSGSSGSGNNGGGGGGNANTNFTSFVSNLVQQPGTGSPVSTNDRIFNNLGTSNAATFANVNFGTVDTPPGVSLATTACKTIGPGNCNPGIHGPQQ